MAIPTDYPQKDFPTEYPDSKQSAVEASCDLEDPSRQSDHDEAAGADHLHRSMKSRHIQVSLLASYYSPGACPHPFCVMVVVLITVLCWFVGGR